MTKEDLVKEVYKENGLSRVEASDIVELAIHLRGDILLFR